MSYIKELVVYSDLIDDPVLIGFESLIGKTEETDETIGYELVRLLLGANMTFEEYLYTKMLTASNLIIEQVGKTSIELSKLHYNCLIHDISIIGEFVNEVYQINKTTMSKSLLLLENMLHSDLEKDAIKAYNNYFGKVIEGLSSNSKNYRISVNQCDEFVKLLRKYGTGPFANHPAFYFNENIELIPIENYCSLEWDDIYEYEIQKEELYENTRAFVSGRPFHHTLLVGVSGTGKSSSVKAVVKRLEGEKLRLIQLYKGQLKFLPKLLDRISKSSFKFILFLDDLSFEVNEDEYKLLKTFMEGGIADASGNIAFYVTTNRRHLIKEVREEREGDIHLQDFIQEMTSLSKRFGLTLTYESLNQDDYFHMIKKMMEDNNLPFDEEELILEARRWSLRKAGMSGRVASQFIKQKMIV